MSVVRFFWSDLRRAATEARVNEDRFVVLRHEVLGDHVVHRDDLGRAGRHVRVQGGPPPTAAPDVPAFAQILASRLADVGLHPQTATTGVDERPPTPSAPRLAGSTRWPPPRGW